VSTDALLRTLAVCAAVAILAAPYYGVVVDAVRAAAAAARANAAGLRRLAAAALIVAAAYGSFQLPSFSGWVNLPAVPVTVPTPSPELQQLVEPVTVALAGASAADRATWAAVWQKAALVIDAESKTNTPVFRDVPALRVLTVTALEIGWRRIAGKAPGSLPGLREAVEAAMGSVLGSDAVPVTDAMRGSYAQVCRAIAWAGTR
jgi:hypothetical protein